MRKRVFECVGDVYASADLHFGHRNIIKYCHRSFLSDRDKRILAENGGKWHTGTWKGGNAYPHSPSKESVEIMDETLLHNINKTVPANGILFLLGDFAMPGRDYDYLTRCKYYRSRINCEKIYFLFGNHDGAELESLFDIPEAHGQKFYDCVPHAIINKVQFFLSHYSNVVWNKSHRTAIQLYGHSHSEAEPWVDKNMPGHRSMDVGIDNAAKILGEYRPFKFSEIIDIMNKRNGHNIGDHHINRNAPEEV